jgi:hypothetical protein
LTKLRSVSRTYASFRLIKRDLDPDSVTGLLGITPSEQGWPGDRRGRDGPIEYGYWGLSSEGHVMSEDLADHIEWLLNRLEPARSHLLDLLDGPHRSDIFCFWEALPDSEGLSAGLRFSASLLRRISSFNIALDLDIYLAT